MRYDSEQYLTWLVLVSDEITFKNEIYSDIVDLIRKLNGELISFNDTKQKTFADDYRLKGIYELKNFQVRLLYRYTNNFRVIIGV